MSDGARISIRDPRVSRALTWFWGALGTAFVGGVFWVASSINELNLNVTRILTQNEAVLRRVEHSEAVNERQDAEINAVQNEVATINGRTMRGPAHGN